ncbi:MAG: ABC transporter ATP-binding protein [Ectothiorhodospiraceae bacterium]|nr:ABC transporter ATP-binding protein [Ectothiorhodospiraceae bacterium]MCH8505259.1 ABC transporter ATP-binding protein [Ectothiorhodospiraceae bacterium]
MIALESVSKRYREAGADRVVLREFSLQVPEGQRLALVGRSGAGKSTVLNLISGMDNPDAGTVLVGGTAVQALSERERTLFRRSTVGFVFQFFNLIPTLTVRENLLLPLDLLGHKGSGAAEAANALLQRVGLEDRGGSFPEQLSGGEQQRVAIARALIHRPRVLLADEPTGTLDEETGEQVLSLMAELTAEHGMTVVMVTHSLDVARRMDRVVRLVDGRPVEA